MACFYQDQKCWCKIIKRGSVAISFHNQLNTQTGPRAALWEMTEPSVWSEWAKGRTWGAVVPCWCGGRAVCLWGLTVPLFPLKSLLQFKDLAAVVVWHDANESESNYTKEEKTRLWTNYFCMNSVSYTKFTHLAFFFVAVEMHLCWSTLLVLRFSVCWCAAASVMGPNQGAQRDMSSCSVRDDLNVD